ncbi:hypothetical protein BS78_05G167800 [Paspalum vaginatum]|nr:hypothetical protein BS78_05G167800 [Paspalum vaginatum]
MSSDISSTICSSSENANGGHCLVKWTKAARPKNLGGLGILDLERFSRALRLRWLWFQWTDQSKPWASTPPCDSTDAALFRASTVITIGNGLSTQFWHDSWLLGKAPMDIAPSLYPLAWRKNKKVHEELVDLNWTRGLWRMDTEQSCRNLLYCGIFLKGYSFQISLTALGGSGRQMEFTLPSQLTLLNFEGLFAPSKPMQFGRLMLRENTNSSCGFSCRLRSSVLMADKLALRHWLCDPVCVLCG